MGGREPAAIHEIVGATCNVHVESTASIGFAMRLNPDASKPRCPDREARNMSYRWV